MPITKTPSLEVLYDGYDKMLWGGIVSVNHNYFNQRFVGQTIHWSSSWESSLKEAIAHSGQNEGWITLIMRHEDNRRRTTSPPGSNLKHFRYIGFVDEKGEFHRFEYLTTHATAILKAFKAVGWEVHGSDRKKIMVGDTVQDKHPPVMEQMLYLYRILEIEGDKALLLDYNNQHKRENPPFYEVWVSLKQLDIVKRNDVDLLF